ncbi:MULTISPECIES: hypothetical protein [Leptolyngbya]|uniref:hypothetical protein n=1 Tax=Leptolyngbya TaxID=47251 RepID=UPI00168968F8|nr:hypothetical protein [Leptolyngbya sp. FACHB-1624]MBD1856403.1 hypothetical protein [Leptolyngbya sp. FACHB-1624]
MMILVTGASRNVGTAVVSCLRTRQAPFRIGSRTAANSVVSQDDVDVVPFDFLNANTFRSADGLSKGQALPLLRDLSALMQFISFFYHSLGSKFQNPCTIGFSHFSSPKITEQPNLDVARTLAFSSANLRKEGYSGRP